MAENSHIKRNALGIIGERGKNPAKLERRAEERRKEAKEKHEASKQANKLRRKRGVHGEDSAQEQILRAAGQPEAPDSQGILQDHEAHQASPAPSPDQADTIEAPIDTSLGSAVPEMPGQVVAATPSDIAPSPESALSAFPPLWSEPSVEMRIMGIFGKSPIDSHTPKDFANALQLILEENPAATYSRKEISGPSTTIQVSQLVESLKKIDADLNQVLNIETTKALDSKNVVNATKPYVSEIPPYFLYRIQANAKRRCKSYNDLLYPKNPKAELPLGEAIQIFQDLKGIGRINQGVLPLLEEMKAHETERIREGGDRDQSVFDSILNLPVVDTTSPALGNLQKRVFLGQLREWLAGTLTASNTITIGNSLETLMMKYQEDLKGFGIPASFSNTGNSLNVSDLISGLKNGHHSFLVQ
jgi:hypothetical protein